MMGECDQVDAVMLDMMVMLGQRRMGQPGLMIAWPCRANMENAPAGMGSLLPIPARVVVAVKVDPARSTSISWSSVGLLPPQFWRF